MQLVPQMFTIHEIAERLHVSVKTVRRWIGDGKLGHYDVGRYDLVSDEQLAAFLEQRRADR